MKRRDKMDELFPDFERIGKGCNVLCWIAFAFATFATILQVACGR